MDPDKSQNNNITPTSSTDQTLNSVQQGSASSSSPQPVEPSSSSQQLNQQLSTASPLQQTQSTDSLGMTQATPQNMQGGLQGSNVRQNTPPSQGMQLGVDPQTQSAVGSVASQPTPVTATQDTTSADPVTGMPQGSVGGDDEPPTTVNSTAALLGNVDQGLSAPREGDDPLSKIEASQQEQTLDSTDPLGLQTSDQDVIGLAQPSSDTAAADLSSPSNMTTPDEEAGSSGKNY